MPNFSFKVIPWCKHNLSSSNMENDFILESDGWNDYDFFTTYHLHIGANILGENESDYLGYIKILKKGQKKIQSDLIPNSFNRLGTDFCSFSASLDLFEKINRHLDKEQRIELMIALRNIVYDKDIIDEFKDEAGFYDSLLRDTDLNNDVFKLAPIYIQEESKLLTDINETVVIKLNNFQNELKLNFGSKFSESYNDIPDRVNVLIGRNGCGKSTILYKICKLLYASSDQRAKHKDKIGSIFPSGIGFTKIICISYSPFDSFQMPGFSYLDKKKLCKEIENKDGRFIYCGIRDIATEIRSYIEKDDYSRKKDNFDLSYQFEDVFFEERTDTTLLKSITALGIEFTDAYFKIKDNQEKTKLFEDCLDMLKLEPSLNEFLAELKSFEIINKEEITSFFNKLSTGHKFVIHSITNIIYHIKPWSIILFDEPENHLHPPLLAILMKTIRMILSKNMSVMIIGTHSPVVLQETIYKNVTILRRDGDVVSVDNPTLQTFGENTGLITSQIFDLTSNITDYHDVYDSLLKQIYYKKWSYDDAFSIIEECLGGQLSNQSYFYLKNKINSKKE